MTTKKQTQEQRNQLSLTNSGKLPPQATDMETLILSALLVESRAYAEVEHILTDEDFYNPTHQEIYKAIQSLASKRKAIDMATITRELMAMGSLDEVGGAAFIAELGEKVASSTHIVHHALIVKQKAIARGLIRVTSEIQSKCYDEAADIDDTLEELEKSLTELMTNTESCVSIPMPEAIKATIDKASETQKLRQQGKAVSTPTGLYSLDQEFAGGWRAPDLIVLGARPSMGKTQMSLFFAKSAAQSGRHVLFASIEMTATQLVTRYLLENERISGYNLRTGQMSEDEWKAVDETAGKLWNLKLHIADNHNIRYLNNIKSEARKLKRKGELDMLIIDYLGLIKTNLKFANRYLEIGYITNELKSLAKELNIPIILLSQLKRPEKGTSVNKPKLEDLRESGDIEQDADIVLFIHKPDYYDPDAQDSQGVKWKGRGQILIGKYREGARNNQIIYHHDDRYKKIWDANGQVQETSPSIGYDPIKPNNDFDLDDNPF